MNCLPPGMQAEHNWICTDCVSDNLPFNHSSDDDTYLRNLNTFFRNEHVSILNEIVYNPFEITDTNDLHDLMPLLDIDPDLQFFHDLANLQNHTGNCQYYLEDSLNKKIANVTEKLFSLFHHNIRSLPRHYNEITSFIDNLNIAFTVIGLSETWLTTSNCDLYNFNGYNHVYQYREHRPGGGVSIFILENINYVVRSDLSRNSSFLECIFLEIPKSEHFYAKDILIGMIYRPPNTDIREFNKSFSEILSIIHSESKVVYLMGDFNVNLLNSETHTTSAEFIEMFYSYGYLPNICKPTRVQNESTTIIDNIFCNEIMNYHTISGILLTDISDHYPIFSICMDSYMKQKESVHVIRDFSEKNIVKFQNMLTLFNWQSVIDIQDCQEAFSFFYDNFRNIFNQCFPNRQMKRNSYLARKPWLSSGIKTSIKTKNKLYVKYKQNPTFRSHQIYKTYRNKVNSLIRSAEKQYYEKEFLDKKHNLKKSWALMKQIINKKKSVINSQFLIDNQATSDLNSITRHFNKFFVNIGPNLAKKIPHTDVDPIQYLTNNNIDRSIYLHPTSDKEVENVINDLRNSSPGYDEINTKLLKCTFQIYLPVLVHLLNLSLSQGIFPNEMKIARVVPLYKSGDVRLIQNYRPVSILPVFSKIFEKIMYNRIIEFVDNREILHDSQFGFRKKRSTTAALIVLVDKILSGLNNGEITLGIFLDFSKAFDTINHKILQNKLSHYGIRGTALEWITDYLSRRKQYVTYNGHDSDFLSISCGVPQGSILGPLLFILYINDLASASDILFPIIYADDSNLFIQGNNLSDMISKANGEMRKIVDWVNANQLCLNINKTYYMVFGSRRRRRCDIETIKVNSNVVRRVYDTKFLGVILDSNLSWDNHIIYIKKKISKSIGIINKARKLLTKETLVTLYYSFIYPYLYYAVELWGCSSRYNLDSLHIMQKKIVRLICKVPFHCHTPPLFLDLKILNVDKIYLYHTSLLMHKIYKREAPSVLRNMFTNSNVYNTRQILQYQLPLFRLSICQKSFRFKGAKIWNYIVKHVNVNFSIFTIKRYLKYHILNHDITP